jgi:putative transposase
MTRHRYSSDLSEAQWARIARLIPPAKPGGRPRSTDVRAVVNAIFYLHKTGCQWRNLPREFPCWSTVHAYYRRWRLSGVWQHIHDTLRTAVRTKAGRQESPSAAIIDSQSVKTTEKGGYVASTPTNRSRAANDTSSSTRWAWSWPWSSQPPACRIAMEPRWC